MLKIFRWCAAGLAWGLLLSLAAVAAEPEPATGYEVQAWNPRKPSPGLQVTDLNGTVWRWAGLRGKVVLLNFWASWCEPCRAEMPSLQRLAAMHPHDLVVLAVNFKESPTTVQQFVQRTSLALPVLPDPQGAMARAWGITIFPSTVLVDAEGRVRGVLRGELDWAGADAERLLQPLFKSVRARP